jgi:hypothetical protein
MREAAGSSGASGFGAAVDGFDKDHARFEPAPGKEEMRMTLMRREGRLLKPRNERGQTEGPTDACGSNHEISSILDIENYSQLQYIQIVQLALFR